MEVSLAEDGADPYQQFVAELSTIVLLEAVRPLQRWVKHSLDIGGVSAQRWLSERPDVSGLIGSVLEHWGAIAAHDGASFPSQLKNRLHAVRHIRNRLAHYAPGAYTSFTGVMEDAAIVRVFLEEIGADSALIGRVDALVEGVVGVSRGRTLSAARQTAAELPPAAMLEVRELKQLVQRLIAERKWDAEVGVATPGPTATPTPRREPKSTTASGNGGSACPRCGNPMKVRTASKGQHTGHRFWGCSTFPRCKGTVSDSTLNPSVADEAAVGLGGSVPSTLFRGLRSLDMAPLRQGAEVVLFDYLTVASSELQDVQDAFDGGKRITGSQWRLEHELTGTRTRHDPETLRALIVAEKILRRGRITRLSANLEARLQGSREHNEPTVLADPAVALEVDSRSAAERAFVQAFAKVVGAGWTRWLSAQVDIAALVGGIAAAGIDGRVDFLLSHPGLPKPVVIEVDGPEHLGSPADVARDAVLSKAGFEVVRLKNDEVLSGTGQTIPACVRRIAALDRAVPLESSSALRIRRAGQIQSALLHMMLAGIVDVAGGEPLRVSSDLISAGVLELHELQLVLDDVIELVSRCGRLYGKELLPAGARAESGAGLHLSFLRPGEGDANTVSIADLHLPVQLETPGRTVTPGLPAAFDKAELDWFLDRIYRKPSLYVEQYAAISRALRGDDSVVLMPTGAGKSIAFQLSGLLLPGRTIVIAPLVSLIRDQAMVLRAQGIDRVLPLTSEDGAPAARAEMYALLTSADALFTYVSPERFQIREFRNALQGMTLAHPVTLLVVDEAHCVSEWGHDFRPSYLRIGQTARQLSGRNAWTPPMMALTGTASRMVLRDLQRELAIPDYEALITPSSFDRKELRFIITHCDSSQKQAQLSSVLTTLLPAEFGRARGAFHSPREAESCCGLIFCPWVNGEFGIAEVQRAMVAGGLPTEIYAGKAPKGWSGTSSWTGYKRRIERAFKRNEVLRIACTKAFGMGIDKPNVRYAVHYGMPSSIESFYQEAGRAGRDRKDALCVLLLSEFDEKRNAWLLSPENTVEEVASRLKQVERAEDDDVTRALYFETKAFKGVATERQAARRVIASFGALDERRKLRVAFGGEQAEYERVFHRLTILGVVSDYTLNYAAKSADLTISGARREEVVDAYLTYIRGYQVARATEEGRKAVGPLAAPTYAAFVVAMFDLYIQFVYDVIERSRRRALGEMLEAARSGLSSADAFRNRILAYLESTQYSEKLDQVLNDSAGGLRLAPGVVDEVVSPREVAELRGQVGRYLETYPDQPALLYIRGLTEALSPDCNDEVARQNFAACFRSASESYGVEPFDVIGAAASALRRLPRSRRAVGDWMERTIIERWPERSHLRHLVQLTGVKQLRVTPWQLLNDVTSRRNTTIKPGT